MIKKRSRLPSSEFRSGNYRTITTPYFSLKIKEGVPGEKRMAVIVSNASVASAAKRNFWKRQAKAMFLASGFIKRDLLIIFSPKIITITKKEFKKVFEQAIKKLS